MYIDSKGSQVLLTALPTARRTAVDSKHPAVFRCTVVENRAPPPLAAKPTPLTDQEIAAKKYNELNRLKVTDVILRYDSTLSLTYFPYLCFNVYRARQETRHLSQIFHMRNLNNWIKIALIEHTISTYHTSKHLPLRVIDFGCGKGGDLNKWVRNRSSELDSYVGVDIAKDSLKNFVERVTKSTNPASAAKVS